jgi:hypothetical protein
MLIRSDGVDSSMAPLRVKVVLNVEKPFDRLDIGDFFLLVGIDFEEKRKDAHGQPAGRMSNERPEIT